MTPEEKVRNDFAAVTPYVDLFARMVRIVESNNPLSARAVIDRLLDPEFVQADINDMKHSPNFETVRMFKRDGCPYRSHSWDCDCGGMGGDR
jgi:hypothetical protein